MLAPGLSVAVDDGLKLDGAYMVAAVRCAPPANLPTPEERATCSSWLEGEVALLPEVHVVLCLGGFAWESALRLRAALGDRPGLGCTLDDRVLTATAGHTATFS